MWQYVGWNNHSSNSLDNYGWYPYWTNASGGGMDVAIGERRWDGEGLSNIPEANAEIIYGALEGYNGDIIAFLDDNGITRDSL